MPKIMGLISKEVLFMTLYLVKRLMSEDMSDPARGVILLPDGRHEINHNRLYVPVTVEGNSVTIHIGQAQGALRKGKLYVVANFTDLEELKRSGVTDITIEPKLEGEYALEVWGRSERGHALSIENHREAPKVRGEKGLG
ncbi:TPA: hypothetical protein DIS61_01785 [Patescibacteria group bacterium]|nr:MAG: hypothetical protein A2699_00270 [Candidatus Gottesmanbacteria bacterium RIFCSPHIGHO2_01_FULL_43_15]OGG27860.1 MAG: hypothetical protein A3A59_00625 [Candidatus Gottesmanbacteria bacterium RIFCSPLOWO2_01_FULL_42_10]HCM37359.1 hypothetical protein [Patescibacteria group bacterium]